MKTQHIIDKYWKQANLLHYYGNCLELMKYEVRKLAMFGKQTSKVNKERESQIIGKIIRLSESISLCGEEQTELASL